MKIIEDYLLFVERIGIVRVIFVRDVEVGDILYVRVVYSVEKDVVLSISKVYEEGVYVLVIFSGIVFVNNVYILCYFDVLFYDWFYRVMGVVCVVYYVLFWIL